jgi:arylsulfatase A-like enzyme
MRDNSLLPLDVPCLPEMLPEHGYVAGYHGKWHLGDEVFLQHGFDEWRSIQDDYHRHYRPDRDHGARSTHYHFLVDNGFRPGQDDTFDNVACTKLPEEYSKTAYLAREASRFIRENCNHPFVLFVGFHEPHPPYHGPRDGQYDPLDVQLPESFHHPPTQDQHPKALQRYRTFYEKGYRRWNLRDEGEWRKLISNYWGLCSQVDTHVGTILETLRECNLYNETLIVFTSDHGDMMGSHRLLQKSVMFKESITVPLIIKMPGRGKSVTIDEPMSHIDLLPTVLDIMGEQTPKHLQGRSLKPVMDGEAVIQDGAIVEWTAPGGVGNLPTAALSDSTRTIVTPDGWRFTYSTMGMHELYYLKDDPMEIDNLARSGEYQELMSNLLEKIQDWQARTQDPIQLPSSLLK